MKVIDKRFSLSLCLLLIAPLPALAEETDQASPIQLEAGSLEIDQKTGRSIYKDNVVLIRGPISIHAQEMTVIAREKEVERIIAIGQPVKFEQLPGEGRKSVRGQANTIEFQAATQQVVLKENAELWQEKDKFSGELIRYDIERELVSAGQSNSGERIRVIIHPKKEPPASQPTR